MKKILISLALLMVAFVGTYIVLKEHLDRFNPFLEEQYVYVQIQGVPEEDNNRFKYKLTGFNQEGKSKNVTFTASVILDEGQYLKVLAKGAYTKEWSFVDTSELPEHMR